MSLADNMRLYDIATRKQVFVEGVKAQYAAEFNTVLRELRIELRKLLSRVKYQTLDGLTKAELNNLVIALRKSQSRIYNAYTSKLIEQLQEFMRVDLTVTRRVYATAYFEIEFDEELEEPVEDDRAVEIIEDAQSRSLLTPLFGLAAVTSKPDRLWASLANTPLPANGLYLLPFIKTFSVSAQASVENMVRRAYANGDTLAQLLDDLMLDSVQGTSSQMQRIMQQLSAVIATSIQFVSNIVSAGVTSSLYGRYRWYSVMDGRTTDICRSRNLKEYRYGQGPLPPAHINCRSHIAPIVGNEDIPEESFYTWVARQPETVQRAALTEAQIEAIKNGGLKQKDLPKFTNPKPMTLDDYAGTVNRIVSR